MKSLTFLLERKPDALKEFLKPHDKKVIDEMLELINRDRRADFRKPLPWIAVKMKVSHLSPADLDWLLKEMRASSYPGKVFFGSLKVKE